MFNQLTQNKMEKDEMIKTILQFEKELWEEQQQMAEYFGADDAGTKNATAKWVSVSQLMDKLKIEIQ
jgi:hypothetical protein